MSNFLRQIGLRRRLSLASFTAAPVTAATLLGVFLVTVPVTRASVNSERTDASERCEEIQFSHRNERIRRLALENLRSAQVRALVVTHTTGRSQWPDFDPPAGHRLSNGLLAPMTC
jgi:hypothetical protein